MANTTHKKNQIHKAKLISSIFAPDTLRSVRSTEIKLSNELPEGAFWGAAKLREMVAERLDMDLATVKMVQMELARLDRE